MSYAVLALALFACFAGCQAQVAGNACTLANMTPWPVPGSSTQYYMCVDAVVRLMTCPANTIFIANNVNVFGCVPFSDVTCTYNGNSGNYYSNSGFNSAAPVNSIGSNGWTYTDYQNYLASLKNGQYQNGWFPNGVSGNGYYQQGYYARNQAAEKPVEKQN